MLRVFPPAAFTLLGLVGSCLAQGTPALERGSPAAASVINRAMNEAARVPKSGLFASDFKVGDFGPLAQNGSYFYEAERILGGTEMVVVPVSTVTGPKRTLWKFQFIVKGVPTKGLVDNRQVALDGLYKVTGTKSLLGRTMFVVEAESEADRAKRVAEELKQMREAEEARAKAEETARREAAIQAAVDAERKAVEAARRAESAAAAKVALARQYIDLGKKDVAGTKLKEVLRDYPKTKAAEVARELLKKL